MSHYQDRVNAERLARQAPDVQKTAKAIFDALKDIERYLYWSLDPSEEDKGDHWCMNLIEHSHELVDLGHEFRAALKANPPPAEVDDDEDDAA